MQFLWVNDRYRCACARIVLLLCCLFGVGAFAQTPAEAATAPTDSTESNAPEQEQPAPPAPAQPNVCFPDGDPRSEDEKWLDKLQERLYRMTCTPSSWFDGLFGNDRFEDEYQNTHGHITLGTLWDHRTGFHRVTRAKVRVYFPNLSDRFNAFVGRIDEDQFFQQGNDGGSGGDGGSGDQTTTLQTPEAFNRNIDDSTLLGLGYNEPLKKRGSFDADVGVRVRFPVDPYVRGSYRYAMPIGDRNLLRLRETIFWQETQRFGTTTRVDWDRVLTDNFFTRWTGSGTFSQETVGMQWYSTLTLYQILRHKRALAYELKSYGSTDNEVPVNNYGVTFIYRRSAWRDWLWIELRTGVDWPRDSLAEKRSSNLNAGLTFELRYFKPK